jgi:hypothetical protein
MDLNEILREMYHSMRKPSPPFASMSIPYFGLGKQGGTAHIDIREHDGRSRSLSVHLLQHPHLYDSNTLAGWLYRRDMAKQTEQEGYL